MQKLASHEASRAQVLWPGTAGVLGVQSCYVGQKVKPRVSGEKRAEDVLPSWRSMQGLTVKKLPSDGGAGVAPQTAKPRDDGVPQECGCQGESNDASVQKDRRRCRKLRGRRSG